MRIRSPIFHKPDRVFGSLTGCYRVYLELYVPTNNGFALIDITERGWDDCTVTHTEYAGKLEVIRVRLRDACTIEKKALLDLVHELSDESVDLSNAEDILRDWANSGALYGDYEIRKASEWLCDYLEYELSLDELRKMTADTLIADARLEDVLFCPVSQSAEDYLALVLDEREEAAYADPQASDY